MLDCIKSTFTSLAPAEQRVGKLLLSDPRTFAGLPVVALAERAQVRKPKIVSFCRSVSYEVLNDIKLKLEGSLSEGVPFNHRNVGAPDTSVAAFLKCRNDASTAAIDKAVYAITLAHEKKKRLKFFGSGNSGILAQDACEIARKKGATTVVITASGSPLLQTGPNHLAADHPESYERFSPTVLRLMHLMIIEVFATSVALRIGSAKLQLLLRNMKQNLLNKRYS